MRDMVGDLQTGQRHGRRTCGVVSMAWRTAAMGRVGGLVGTQLEPGSGQAIEVTMLTGHAIRPWGATVRASASTAARSARVAWWRRDRAVPAGMPSVSAISTRGRPWW